MAGLMKTFNFQKTFLAVITVAGLALSTMAVAAQDSPASTAPPLAYGVPQVLQLAQAKVTDDVIIAYIHNSGNSYGLNADQIIYLRQQGISDNVLTTMLTQPKPAAVLEPTTPAPVNPYPAQTPITYPQPAPTYDQSDSYPNTYVMPNNQIYYYSSYYPFYYPTYYYPFYYPYYRHPFARNYPFARHYSSASLSFRYGGGFHGNSFHGNSFGGSFHGGAVSYGGGGGYHGGGGGMMMHH
jgi:uncharacterized membrane protein YgcG